MKDEIYMREALKEAALARDNGNWAIGCVITLDGEIVARGRNHVFTQQNRLLHAEMDAIAGLQSLHFDSLNKNLTLYTTLEPCPMCFGAILLAGIRQVVAGSNLDHSGASASIRHIPPLFKQPHFRTTLTTGVLEKECEEMWLSGVPAQMAIERGVKIKRNKGVKIHTSPTTKGPNLYAPHPKPQKKKFILQKSTLKSLFSSVNS